MKILSRVVMSFALVAMVACGEDEHGGLSTSPSATAKQDAGVDAGTDGGAEQRGPKCGFGTSPSCQ